MGKSREWRSVAHEVGRVFTRRPDRETGVRLWRRVLNSILCRTPQLLADVDVGSDQTVVVVGVVGSEGVEGVRAEGALNLQRHRRGARVCQDERSTVDGCVLRLC